MTPQSLSTTNAMPSKLAVGHDFDGEVHRLVASFHLAGCGAATPARGSPSALAR